MDSIAIRRATVEDAASMARVHIASWRSTYKHIFPAELLAKLSENDRAERWRKIILESGQLETVLVAESAEVGIVGLACCGRCREEHFNSCGELSAIYLHDDFHRRGIGRRLLVRAAKELSDRSFVRLVVFVLEQNPACRFYEALGGRVLERKVAKIGDGEYPGLFYSWDDITNLIQRNQSALH